jgi:hypothetical protein
MSREEALLEAIRELAPEKAREILVRAGQIEGQGNGHRAPKPTAERVTSDPSIKLSEEEIEEVRRELQKICEQPGPGEHVLGFYTPEEWARAAHDTIAHEECQRALARIPGSLSQAVIEEREERF